MVNVYNWADGVELKEHTQCKLNILRKYFHQYLRVKCSPMVRRFRIAIVDGFAGGGIYEDGAFGSPLIFLQELEKFARESIIGRQVEGLPELSIECLFIVNEIDPDANQSLYHQLDLWQASNNVPKEHLNVKILKLQKPFIEAYPTIKEFLLYRRFQNVLFNIDPYGYSQVKLPILQDIMTSFKNAEIFYTFMIGALFQYASWQKRSATEESIKELGFTIESFFKDETLRKKSEWLGGAEKLIHEEFSKIANFVSPFAINQQSNLGYNYWLLHFANSYRAREVYNDVLYTGARSQAHFGKSGLKMLEYTPEEGVADLFEFSKDTSSNVEEVLHYDIPRFISEFGDAMSVGNFRSAIYNDTPAHSEYINNVLIKNPDIDVLTDKNRPRRAPESIRNTDFIRLKEQKSFYNYFGHSEFIKPKKTKLVSREVLLESIKKSREKNKPILDYLKDK